MTTDALIIEDDQKNWELIKKRLEVFKQEVVLLNDEYPIKQASKAIETIQQQAPDLIFLDLMLEDSITGFEILDFLVREKLDVQVMVISSHAREAEKLKQIMAIKQQSNLNISWLLKPIDTPVFDTTLRSFLAVKQTKTLIVEDNLDTFNYLHRVLSKYNRFLLVNQSATSSAKLAIRQLEKYLPQVVILDLALEKSDGFEVLDFIQSKSLKTAVVLLSGVVDDNQVYQERLLAYSDLNYIYLPKPFDEQRLIEAIHGLSQPKLPSLPVVQEALPQDQSILTILTQGFKFLLGRFQSGLSSIETKIDRLATQNIPQRKGFALSQKRGLVVIRFDDLVYAEVDGNGTLLYLVDHQTGKLRQERSTKRIGNLMEEYHFPRNFCRIHASTVVNLDFLARISSSKTREMELKLPQQQSITLEIAAKKYTEVASYVTDYMHSYF